MPDWHRCRILPLLVLSFLLMLSSVSRAATSVMIWPINPQIEGDQKAVALWLENRGQAAISLQVRVLA